MKAKLKYSYSRLLLATAGGLLCLLLSWLELVSPLDNIIYDASIKYFPPAPPTDTLIITIDDRSVNELGRWPWPRERHVELLRRLQKAGVKHIAFDILFAESDKEYPEVDLLLADEIRQHGSVVLPVFVSQQGSSDQVFEVAPIAPMAEAAAGIGHVQLIVDSDGISRSINLEEGSGANPREHFSLVLARLSESLDQTFSGPLPSATPYLFPLTGPAGTIDSISYTDVIKGQLPADIFRNKLVFIGVASTGHLDNISTPLGQMSGVEINANIFHALKNRNLAKAIQPNVRATISFIIAFLIILGLTIIKPAVQLTTAFLGIIAAVSLSISLLLFSQLWYPPAALVITLSVFYPFWNWIQLRSSVNFMQKELALLEKENSSAAFKQDWKHLEDIADFLRETGNIHSWKMDLPSTASTSCNTKETGWQRVENNLRKCFSVDNETRCLTLQVADNQEISEEQLATIFPVSTDKYQQPPHKGSLLENDIEKLKHAYREAQYNRKLVRKSIAQLPNGIVLADTSGKIILLNEQTKKMLSLEVLPKNLLTFFEKIKFTNKVNKKHLVSNLLKNIDFILEGQSPKSGKDILCRASMIRLNRPTILICLTDVTELKASEKSRAEALNFLSHDLRAPLTSVLALIERAKSENHDGLNLKLLEDIERYIQHNLAYAENFTQLARLEYTALPSFDICDARSLIDNAVSQVFHAAANRSIQLNLQISDEDIWVSCNLSIIERAILNLIDNALKHSPDNSKIIISLSGDKKNAIIKVSDLGEGIDQNEIKYIFEAFKQGSQAKSGVGLGLQFVAAAARSHHGSVSVESEIGVGTTFTLTIPKTLP